MTQMLSINNKNSPLLLFHTKTVQLEDWQIKSFVVLTAQFHRVLLLEGDVFLLQTPSILRTTNISTIFFVDHINLT
jgi:hypothetical protein